MFFGAFTSVEPAYEVFPITEGVGDHNFLRESFCTVWHVVAAFPSIAVKFPQKFSAFNWGTVRRACVLIKNAYFVVPLGDGQGNVVIVC